MASDLFSIFEQPFWYINFWELPKYCRVIVFFVLDFAGVCLVLTVQSLLVEL